jgi:hypothetical protein
MHLKLNVFLLTAVSGVLMAQSNEPADLQRILQRLDALEKQNRELTTEIRLLREQLAAGGAVAATTPSPAAASAAPETPPLTERITVAEQRIRDLAQSTVQSEHHSAIQLSGMALFNTYINGRFGGQQYPTTAAAQPGTRADGAGFRQTIVGLKFQAPEHVGGAEVTGAVYFDLWGGSGRTLDQDFRLRIANVEFNWKNTTLTFAQDKPILAQRDPDSLAQVAISPLTDAGNLWLWRPQARLEQRFHFGDTGGLRAQVGIVATSETANLPAGYTGTGVRPSVEGRFVFWKQAGDKGDFEFAPGFHVSNSQLGGYSIPSRIASVDWRVPLARAFALTGTAFLGENVGVIGGLLQGIVVPYRGDPRAVHAAGGWAQLEYRATRRLSLHVFAGQEDDRRRDLQTGLIDKNQQYGANAMYAFLSNVVASFEASFVQTAYVGSPTRLNPHYDLALAYLF